MCRHGTKRDLPTAYVRFSALRLGAPHLYACEPTRACNTHTHTLYIYNKMTTPPQNGLIVHLICEKNREHIYFFLLYANRQIKLEEQHIYIYICHLQ